MAPLPQASESAIIKLYRTAEEFSGGSFFVGEWLSLVEHLVRDQGVGGSNPLSPTILSLADSSTYAAFARLTFTRFFGTFGIIHAGSSNPTPFTPSEVAVSSAGNQRAAFAARDEKRSGPLVELRQSGRMVDTCMAVDSSI